MAFIRPTAYARTNAAIGRMKPPPKAVAKSATGGKTSQDGNEKVGESVVLLVVQTPVELTLYCLKFQDVPTLINVLT